MARHLLIVEDDSSLRNLFERAFNMVGFTVETAADGDEAMQHLGQTLPDVVVLDLGIPGKSGLAILKHIRRHERMLKQLYPDQHKRVNVIVVTGNQLAHDSAEASLADIFLLKPVEVQQLLTLAQHLSSTTERLAS